MSHHCKRSSVSIYKQKVKVKLSLCFFLTEHHATKAYWEWRYSSTHSLTSALDGGEWSHSRPGRFTLKGKSTWYPLARRLGGPQSRFGRGGEEKNSQPLPGIETPIIQPVAHSCTTELSRLLHRNKYMMNLQIKEVRSH
jgi:hypothetical protein